MSLKINRNKPVEIKADSHSQSLGEAWEYRELLYFLAWRDVRVRYKQTIIGAAWAVVQPLTGMVIFSIFFGRLARIPSDGIPYPVFTLVALVIWNFLSQAISQAAASLVGSANLLRKIYFPRILIPTAAIAVSAVDLLIAALVLMPFIMCSHILWSWRLCLVVPFVLLAAITAMGISYWFSALHIQYRDARFVTPFLIQLWMFMTPVVYPSSLIPGAWRVLYGVNPAAGVIEGLRWAVWGTGVPPGMIIISAVVSVFLLCSGYCFFQKVERHFADIV